MNELWIQGLLVSLVGLAVTFAALGLLIGLMALLMRLFPAEAVAGESAVSLPVDPVPPVKTIPEPDQVAIAAAIATAIALAHRDEQDQQLGHGLEGDRGPWWYKGSARERSKR